jgi:hypothetical protein
VSEQLAAASMAQVIAIQHQRIAELRTENANLLQGHILRDETMKESGVYLEKLEDKIEAAKGLLTAAVCPACDKSGAYYDNYGEPVQCQWCYEVSLLND